MDTKDLIYLSALYETWDIYPDDNGLLHLKDSRQIANGVFNAYHYSLGLFKTNNVSVQARIKNGVIIELTKFDKQGNIIYSNVLDREEIRIGEIKYWEKTIQEQSYITDEIKKSLSNLDKVDLLIYLFILNRTFIQK